MKKRQVEHAPRKTVQEDQQQRARELGWSNKYLDLADQAIAPAQKKKSEKEKKKK